MELRDYQIAAIDAASECLRTSKTALIVAPTGSGKAIIIAAIAARAIKRRPNVRLLCLCTTQEILKQNEEKLNILAPDVETGIYCAGAGRKDRHAQVVFASRDSLGRDPLACGIFDGILVDEAHQVAVDIENSETMYAKIINAQNPKFIVGLTGTPWRLAGGRIWGNGKLFEKIAFNIPMRTLIERGYLSRYRFPECETQIDTSDIGTSSNGDFIIRQLEGVTGESLSRAAVKEWLQTATDRRVSLFFCVSRAHGKLLTRILKEYIDVESVCYIDGESRDRNTLNEEIRAGKYRAIVNIGTLTTGFDAPIIDCVVFLRPTKSASLFIQMAGRGLRNFPGKSDCLFLDMAGNFERFGSIETPQVNSRESKESAADEDEKAIREAPTKQCPSCSYEISARSTYCHYCGEVFVKANQKPFTGARPPEWFVVGDIAVSDYVSAKGNHCKKIEYFLQSQTTMQGKTFSEYFVKRNPKAMLEFKERMKVLHRRPKAILAQVDGILLKPVDYHY